MPRASESTGTGRTIVDPKIRIDVEWHTGAHTQMTIERPKVGVWAPKTPQAAVERIRELLPHEDYTSIASRLNEEGFQTAKGLKYDDKAVGYVARTRAQSHADPAQDGAIRAVRRVYRRGRHLIYCRGQLRRERP